MGKTGENGELVFHGDDASRSTGPGYAVEVKYVYFDVSLSRSVGCARADRLARRWMADYNAIRF